MRKFLLVAALAGFAGTTWAKQVDVQTAKVVGLHFLESELGANTIQGKPLELVYTAKATDGTITYYVFNAGSQAFVMVAADDQVKPVFGYSGEGIFDPNNIPPNATGILKHYTEQIKYLVANKVPATEGIATKWEMLKSNTTFPQRTTATTVAPLLATRWNQAPYYNDLCPVDFNTANNDLSVAGCVATAMAQVMKYWNYPQKGTGTHTYNSDLGTLTVDFGATTYDWNAMPNAIATSNTAVATINYHAGVAVDMNYSAAASGAQVLDWGGGYPSAENALKTYFGYKSSLQGIQRQNYSYTQWIDILVKELDNSRPVLYAGFGAAGGHCWVADGYDASKMFHINWGWGGSSDGYFDVEGMNPPSLGIGGGGGGFNDDQQLIIGIEPANMGTPDKYENNNTKEKAYQLPIAWTSSNVSLNTEGSNYHVTNDFDYYRIDLPAGDNYILDARLQDKGSSNNGKTYTLDAKFAVSVNGGSSWAIYEDSTMATKQIQKGGVILFRVAPNKVSDMGTYQLDIDVQRIPTGVANVNGNGVDVNVYPNPANGIVNIGLNTKGATISLVDMQGRIVETMQQTGATTSLATGSVANGLYFIHIASGGQTTVRKITIAH